tara:strand:+ start:858 stop:1091 length:234 start_codon:yes stop_codon:yes gene_type:complete
MIPFDHPAFGRVMSCRLSRYFLRLLLVVSRLKRCLDFSMIDGCLSCRVVNIDRSMLQKVVVTGKVICWLYKPGQRRR